jgi:cell wall-associated NlpC family hydrolase
MFCNCDEGIAWFKAKGQWQDSGGYVPVTGDLIFFDWDGDGSSDHVGIVAYVEGGTVHTIEGNTSDSVARRSYGLDSVKVMGYGVPVYS